MPDLIGHPWIHGLRVKPRNDEVTGKHMSNLWDLSHIQPETRVVLEGDTIPAMFWNGVDQRGAQVWMRQKQFGIWRAWTWTQTGEAVREIAGGLMSLGFAPGETASILSNTVIEWVLADIAVLSCGGVSNGIYPTDAASQMQYLCEDSRTRDPVRRRRRAAGQGIGNARPVAAAHEDRGRSTWRACASSMTPA